MAAKKELPDLDSMTNSVMLAIEKEMRKYNVAAPYHRHYTGNRDIIKGMLGIMLYTAEGGEPDGKRS